VRPATWRDGWPESSPSLYRIRCPEMTKDLVTQRVVGVVAAIAAGIGLWRFTSGAWIEGIVFTCAVAGVAAFYLLRDRRGSRDTRRY
jgi:hypothetical protein